MFKSKSKKFVLGILLCLCAALFALPSIVVSQKAYAYDCGGTSSNNVPKGDSVIGNLYNFDKDKFNKDNLDALAEILTDENGDNYSGIDALLEDMGKYKDPDDPYIRTSADFGDIIVNFGSYEFNGTAHELAWIPAYVSQSDDGPILTLWLAYAESENKSSNQEISSFSDGTYNTAPTTTKAYNGVNIFSNTYDGSYIRHYVLNRRNDYARNFGQGTSVDSDGTKPDLETMTKFKQFADYDENGNNIGKLSSYIVTPSKVSWQTDSGYQKNDPGWNGSGTGVRGTGENYTSDWLNDYVWLPSTYEVFDRTIEKNSVVASPASKFTENGGLWQTGDGSTAGRKKRTNYRFPARLRSAMPTYTYYGFGLTTQGSLNINTTPHGSSLVRPALHLNLSAASGGAAYSCDHSVNNWTTTKEATCSEKGQKQGTCSLCGRTVKEDIPTAHKYTNYVSNNDATCLLNGTATAECDFGCGTTNTEEQTGTKLEHEWATAWTTDQTHHWHVCNLNCGTKGSNAAHNYTWKVDTPATVTSTGVKHEECVCGLTRNTNTEIPILTCSHPNKTHHEAVAATCVATGTVEYWSCGDCGKNLDSSGKQLTTTVAPIDSTAHSWATTWSKDGTNHWHDCTRQGCGGNDGKVAHTFTWKVDTPATVTSTGLKHEECSCGETRNENTEIPVETCSHSNKTQHAAVAATCVADGNPEYWTCNDCNKNLDSSNVEISTTVIPKDPNAHNMGSWVQTVAPTYTADGEQRRECQNAGCNHYETQAVPMLQKAQAAISGLTFNDVQYGDFTEPAATASHGSIVYTYSTELNGTYTADKPVNAGTYYVKATIADGEDYLGVEETASFTILPREITVTINAGSSKQGDDFEELTATVTSGSIVGSDNPYTLSTNADKTTIGEYAITGTGTDANYKITFINGVYIVSKKAEDPNGNGEIDLPVDINVEFKVTQSQTSGDYSELGGLKTGYWAQLWYRNEDGTLGDEFTDKMNCILTLKIPTDIIEAIRGGEEINREKIAAGLSVYYVNDGNLTKVEAFTIAQKEDESWIVKFNYNEKFRAEVVFNAAGVEDSAPEEPEQAGIPWWVWLLVGLGSATLLAIIIVIIVVAKKKSNNDGTPVDNSEVLSQLAEQGEKIDELLGRDDGGFNTPVELDENGNVIFK